MTLKVDGDVQYRRRSIGTDEKYVTYEGDNERNLDSLVHASVINDN